MNDIALSLKNVSKKYKIYQSPKDRLKELIFQKKYHQEFWALKEVSFSLKKGEVLGIIGENGAGKSTLLKIIARTIQPSSGEIIVNGRISAILELGMGFHPELTGLENIYLAATLLGLSSKKIKQYLPEIIDFAEIGPFIHQPVKTYSSGMYVRLAFSIATVIEPDILVVDEALSVGDQTFQKKCINKVVSLCQKNKTILFCSHSMYHILEFCRNAIWLKNGQIYAYGPAEKVVSSYKNYCEQKRKSYTFQINKGKTLAWIEKVTVQTSQPDPQKITQQLVITVYWKSKAKISGHVGVAIQTTANEVIFGVSTKSTGLPPMDLDKINSKQVVFPKVNLLNGEYQAVGVLLDDTGLQVLDLKVSSSFRIQGPKGVYGHCFLEHKWC